MTLGWWSSQKWASCHNYGTYLVRWVVTSRCWHWFSTRALWRSTQRVAWRRSMKRTPSLNQWRGAPHRPAPLGNRMPVIGSSSPRDGAEAQPEASQPLPRPTKMYKDTEWLQSCYKPRWTHLSREVATNGLRLVCFTFISAATAVITLVSKWSNDHAPFCLSLSGINIKPVAAWFHTARGCRCPW